MNEELDNYFGRRVTMKGKIQAISDKKLPKARSFKIEDKWYGVWLQDQEGLPTELAWMASLATGDILPEFETKQSGDFVNIVSAKAPVISVTPQGEAKKAPVRDDPTGRSIEAQVAAKCAALTLQWQKDVTKELILNTVMWYMDAIQLVK
jgi:hypothetical protein